MKKHLISCSNTPSCIKVETASPLSAGSETASKPSTSADIEISVLEGECTPGANTSPSTAAISTLKMGKSSTLKRTTDHYLDSINQTENMQLDELLATASFSSGSPLTCWK
jgi:hypothetical protein